MGPTYVLHYFNVTGRAEAIRLLFHVADTKFEDKQYTFAEWGDMKVNNATKFPLGQMPVLEIDGKVVCQSLAIIRHLASEFKLYGKNGGERLIADQIMETLNDVFNNASKIKFDTKLNEEEKKKAFADYFKGSKKAFNFIMALVNNTDGVFTFGDEVSLPDILLFSGYEFINAVYPEILNDYPNLVRLAEAVKGLDRIQEYLSCRKHAGMK